MSRFNFNFEVHAIDKHKSLAKTTIIRGKQVIEEYAPTAYVHYIEKCDFWGNKFIIVAKNIPIELRDDIRRWIRDIKRSFSNV